MNLFIFQLSDSPSGSDLNMLGEYLLVSLGFVVVAMAEFALVLLIDRNATSKTNVMKHAIAPRENEKTTLRDLKTGTKYIVVNSLYRYIVLKN